MVESLNFLTPRTDPVSVWDGARRLTAYADPWSTQPEAFYDLYDLLPRLCAPEAHMQMEGRRGTGKTMLMVNAYLKLRRQFEETKGTPPYTVAIYVDLSQDVGVPRSHAPMMRGYMLYQQVLQLILTASLRPGHRRDRRFWGLQDYLDERPQWFRRLYGRFRLDRYRRYADNLATILEQDSLYQNMTRAMRGEMKTGQPIGSNLKMARVAMPKGQPLPPAHHRTHTLPAMVYEKRLLALYRAYGIQTRDLLEAVLDALQIKRLILFIDEWSGPSIGSETQPFLYEQLAHTFLTGGRVVLRLATIPGATRLTFDSSTTHVPAVHLDQLASFQPNWMRRRLLRMLMSNLAATLGSSFPSAAYLTDEQEQQGYPFFLHDIFQDQTAADELLRASESLPRQMLVQFMAAVQLRGQYGNTRKLSAAHVRMAAGEHFASQLAVTIRQDLVVSAVFEAIIRAGSRVVDVENAPAFFEALDWLANEGVIFRVDAPAGPETTLTYGCLRYKLSYPADVYRLTTVGHACANSGLDMYKDLDIENVVYPERHTHTPQVLLSPLIPSLFGSA
jgi:hypothetical protein